MSDFYVPLLISNSRSAVHLQGTWIPGGHQEMSLSRSCCFSQTEAKPHTGLENVPGPRDSCGHHWRGDLSGLSQRLGLSALDCFYTWTSLQLSEPLSPPLSKRHFYQMTQGVPSLVPHTSDSGVCSQTCNTIYHPGIWKHKSTFSTQIAPNGKDIKTSLEIRRQTKLTSHNH